MLHLAHDRITIADSLVFLPRKVVLDASVKPKKEEEKKLI